MTHLPQTFTGCTGIFYTQNLKGFFSHQKRESSAPNQPDGPFPSTGCLYIYMALGPTAQTMGASMALTLVCPIKSDILSLDTFTWVQHGLGAEWNQQVYASCRNRKQPIGWFQLVSLNMVISSLQPSVKTNSNVIVVNKSFIHISLRIYAI